MKYDVITIGSSLEDIIFYTSECKTIDNKHNLLCQKMLAFEYGAKIKVDKIIKTFGGGASNTAISMARLGLKVAIVSTIGNDERGRMIVNNLKNHKVSTTLLQTKKDTNTGYSFLVASSLHSKEHIIFSDRGANLKLEITNKILSNLNNSKIIYITSLQGKWKTNLKKIFSLDKPKIAWNIGGSQLNSGYTTLKQYINKTHTIILNKDEALELVTSDKKNKNLKNRELNNENNLLKIIKDYGPKIVLITSGRNGAFVYDGNKIYHQKLHKERRREDTTGVGDAFGSSFIAGLEKYNNNIKKSLALASRNSASVIAMVGAQNGLIKLNKKTVN